MKSLRHLFIITLVIEAILCGVLVIILATANDFMAAEMLAGAVRGLIFFVGMLCALLFIDGIFYMQQMNRAIQDMGKSAPVYECEPMIDAMDWIDMPASPRITTATQPNRADAAA